MEAYDEPRIHNSRLVNCSPFPRKFLIFTSKESKKSARSTRNKRKYATTRFYELAQLYAVAVVLPRERIKGQQ